MVGKWSREKGRVEVATEEGLVSGALGAVSVDESAEVMLKVLKGGEVGEIGGAKEGLERGSGL